MLNVQQYALSCNAHQISGCVVSGCTRRGGGGGGGQSRAGGGYQ
jgi:hypothetical protein